MKKSKTIKIIILSYFLLSFYEWFLHKFVMHGNPKILKKIPLISNYLLETNKHHIDHHKEVDMDMKLNTISRKESLFFNWKVSYVFYIVYFITLYIIIKPKNIILFSLYVTLIILMECFLWNNIHNDMHDSNITISMKEGFPNHPGLLSKGPIYRYLWKQHALHHLQKNNKGNFNIIFPGFDLLVGSYQSKMYDNLDYCKENPNNNRVCKNKLLIKKIITNNDVLPKQI